MRKKGLVFLVICLTAIIIVGVLLLKQKITHQKFIERGRVLSSSVVYPPDYLIVLLGDSMTEALGNSSELRAFMDIYYPGKTFDFLNYGFGSTNVLTVPKRLTAHTSYGRDFRPILEIPFEIIIIESFGYNPLSEFPLEEGLKKQTEALDEIVSLIKSSKPESKIVFMATIAPNRDNYGKGSVDLSLQKRREWADERISYIKNHIQYAQKENIPLINVFEKSRDRLGSGKLEYIDKSHIHPSPNGVLFISKEIADFIYQTQLLTE